MLFRLPGFPDSPEDVQQAQFLNAGKNFGDAMTDDLIAWDSTDPLRGPVVFAEHKVSPVLNHLVHRNPVTHIVHQLAVTCFVVLQCGDIETVLHDAPDLVGDELYRFQIQVGVVGLLVADPDQHDSLAMLNNRQADHAFQFGVPLGQAVLVGISGVIVEYQRFMLAQGIRPDAGFTDRIVFVVTGLAIVFQSTTRPGDQFDGLFIVVDEMEEGDLASGKFLRQFQTALYKGLLIQLFCSLGQLQQGLGAAGMECQRSFRPLALGNVPQDTDRMPFSLELQG